MPYQPKSLEDFIQTYCESDERRIRFAWNGKHADEFRDANQDFRHEVLEVVSEHTDAAPPLLLRDLFRALTARSVQWHPRTAPDCRGLEPPRLRR